jgi:hypothetical protein
MITSSMVELQPQRAKPCQVLLDTVRLNLHFHVWVAEAFSTADLCESVKIVIPDIIVMLKGDGSSDRVAAAAAEALSDLVGHGVFGV